MPGKKSAKPSLGDKLRHRLKSLSQKFPKFNRAAAKMALTDTLCVALAMAALCTLSLRLPEAYNAYLMHKVGSKVYKIQAKLDGGGGTGFQMRAPSGADYVVTNSHVCELVQEQDEANNKGTALVVSDDGSWVRRRIIVTSDKTDLCLIEGVPGVHGLSLGSEPNVGERMTIVGHPHLRPTTLSAGNIVGREDVQILDYVMDVTNPMLAGMLEVNKDGKCDMPKNEIKTEKIPDEIGGGEVKLCFVNTEDAYMTSITIFPGNSGSPMVNFWGNVVGVAFAGSKSDNYGEVISLDDLKTFLARY